MGLDKVSSFYLFNRQDAIGASPSRRVVRQERKKERKKERGVFVSVVLL
jgi:hypothetical protein